VRRKSPNSARKSKRPGEDEETERHQRSKPKYPKYNEYLMGQSMLHIEIDHVWCAKVSSTPSHIINMFDL